MGVLIYRLVILLLVLTVPLWAQTSEQVNTTGTQTLTNKTYSNPIFSGSATGTYTLAGTPTLSGPTISNPTVSGTIGGSAAWPSPGAIGAGTASSGRFTTVTTTGAITLVTPTITAAAGSPEGVLTAPIGSLYLRTNGSTGTTFYIKESGAGNTGWVPFSTSAVAWGAPGAIGATTPNTGAFTALSVTGQFTSTVSTGTAPLVVASTTKVTNLNVDLLDGGDWSAPGAIGSTTPAAITGTTVQANTAVHLGTAAKVLFGSGSPEGVVTANVGSTYHRTDGGAGTILYTKESGTGNAGWTALAPSTINWAVPGTIGTTTPNAGVFTTLTATKLVWGLFAPTYGASVAVNASNGNVAIVSASNSSDFTVANPTNASTGQPLIIMVKNTSGGTLGVITWDTLYKLGTFTKPTSGKARSVTFVYTGTHWAEVACSPEIPNPS